MINHFSIAHLLLLMQTTKQSITILLFIFRELYYAMKAIAAGSCIAAPSSLFGMVLNTLKAFY
jgi:hypothetical protein